MKSVSFSFGKNWKRFLKYVNERRLEEAKISIKKFMGREDLNDMSFLDIGCGSGLFSCAALKLNAKNVFSFDLDPFSLDCCRFLQSKVKNPDNWKICEGSILDENFVSRLGKFDVVYSWGVLHHTGNLWEAMRKSARLVNDGGFYYIALYNKTGGIRGSKTWTSIKRLYNMSPGFGKYLLEISYIVVYYFMPNIVRLKNPFSTIRDYKKKRGANWKTDAIDWLGGYPYEPSTVDEVLGFMRKEFPDFKVINIKRASGLENNWFLFKKSG